MEINVVTAARFEGGKLVAMLMGRADGATNAWIREPVEVTVLQVVNEVMARNKVTTIFRHDGHRVPGPDLKVISDRHGVETVVPERVRPGYSLQDLPRF